MDACDRDQNQDKQFEQIFSLMKKKLLSNENLHCSFEKQTAPKTSLRNAIASIFTLVQKPSRRRKLHNYYY